MKKTTKKIGHVVHYFDKIKVAVISLTAGDLKIGDSVELTGKNGEKFNQKVTSMQIEHANIDIAGKGDEFGLKVDLDVKDNSDVEKV